MCMLNRLAWLVVTMVVCASGPVEAGVWEWLERLSGPGPFQGVAEEVPIICDGAPAYDTSSRGFKPQKSPYQAFWNCWNRVPAPRASDAGDASAHGSRLWHVSLYVARLATNDNDLPYAVEPSDRGIVVWRVGSRATWHANRYFDVNSGLIFNHYSSKGDAFDSLWRPNLELMGITWRPFSRSGTTVVRRLTFPMRSALLLQGIDAADLGATGSFKTGHEVQFSIGIAYDFFTW